MPPKKDPYATRSSRIFDLVLILCAIIAIAVAIGTAPRHQRSRSRDKEARNPPASEVAD